LNARPPAGGPAPPQPSPGPAKPPLPPSTRGPGRYRRGVATVFQAWGERPSVPWGRCTSAVGSVTVGRDASVREVHFRIGPSIPCRRYAVRPGIYFPGNRASRVTNTCSSRSGFCAPREGQAVPVYAAPAVHRLSLFWRHTTTAGCWGDGTDGGRLSKALPGLGALVAA